MTHMPEFGEVEDFPAACDHLAQYPLENWNGFYFTSPQPAFPFSEIAEVLDHKVGFLPWEEFRFDATRSRDYLVKAHWALYCDNYLEGFHIPFVHPDLNALLDFGSYYTELYPYLNLQVGLADGATEVFELPRDHEDYGKQVAAYYFWIFPNQMWNVYPWGLSVNVLQPLGPARTK
ncbi:MAG TPA: choline monooxygenase, partial [Cytophagales bacterium]|nr:choline monooxygenase [Cytophagales bacterium]